MRSSILLAIAASLSSSSAVYQGFNYGSTQTDGSVKSQADFESEFKTAQSLVGANGFSSARLYTMIQGGTANSPIAAIPAAIKTKTSLLLGMWASAGETIIDNEIDALKSAIKTYGTDFTSLIAGLSIGSEDLYRITPTGILNKENPGADPAVLVKYINKVKSALSDAGVNGIKIGHVDTWTAWVNGSNADVIKAVDWLGVDSYPYFQDTQTNGIDQGYGLFFDAFDATVAVSGGKEVWITETGWPVSGKTRNLAEASIQNAKTYWDQVGCGRAFGKINTWWFTLQDSFPSTPNPSFGIVGSTLSTTPLYDLSCSNVTSVSSSATASSTKASSSVASSASTAATNVASSGNGLTPTQGSGGSGGSGTSISSAPSAVITSIPSNGTFIMTTMTPSGTGKPTGPAGTTTGPVTVPTNGASFTSGSVAGAVVAMIAVLAL